jgi:hypothetical protein
MRKMTALVAGGIGYVLGARAGRERYEQIRGLALQVKSNPKVQKTAQQAAQVAKEAAPVVKDKVTGGSDSSGTTSTSSPSGVPLEDSAYPQG